MMEVETIWDNNENEEDEDDLDGFSDDIDDHDHKFCMKVRILMMIV